MFPPSSWQIKPFYCKIEWLQLTWYSYKNKIWVSIVPIEAETNFPEQRINVAASGSKYSGPKRFKTKDAASLSHILLLTALACTSSAAMRLPEGKFGWLIWLKQRFGGVHFGKAHCAASIFARQGLIYVALNCQRGFCESYQLKWLLLLELWKGPYSTTLFPFRVAEACHWHANTWLETHHCCASTVEQNHKLLVWRPPHSSEAVR